MLPPFLLRGICNYLPLTKIGEFQIIFLAVEPATNEYREHRRKLADSFLTESELKFLNEWRRLHSQTVWIQQLHKKWLPHVLGHMSEYLLNPYHPNFPKPIDPDLKDTDVKDDKTLYMHHHQDWVQAGYISPEEPVKTRLIGEFQHGLDHLINGRRDCWVIPSPRYSSFEKESLVFTLIKPKFSSFERDWHNYILQFLLVGKTHEQLKTLINNIDQIDLDANGYSIARCHGDYLRLRFNQRDNDECTFPIFEEFCSPDHPYPHYMTRWQELRFEVIWKASLELPSEVNDLTEFDGTSIFQIQYQVGTTPNHPETRRVLRLIEEWQGPFKEYCPVRDGLTTKIGLRFSHPVSCLLFWVNEEFTGDQGENSDGYYGNGLDLIESVELKLNGETLLKAPGSLLNLGLTKEAVLHSPRSDYYVINFSELDPFQGFDVKEFKEFPNLNFSRFDNASLEIKWKPHPKDLFFSVMAKNTNMISHSGGYIAKTFAN